MFRLNKNVVIEVKINAKHFYKVTPLILFHMEYFRVIYILPNKIPLQRIPLDVRLQERILVDNLRRPDDKLHIILRLLR